MAASEGDKYRSYLTEEDVKNTTWRFGPPNYDAVNKLFEEGRTKIWPVGSLEEKVQRLVKTWEMEIVHKVNPDEYKTLDAKKFTLGINGRKALTLEEAGKLGGSYNVFLQTGLPENFRVYNPANETAESSQKVFTTTFARGFAVEILQVYSGPPLIVYKFRHWGFMEGPFKGHAPTGEMLEFFGLAIFELDEHSKAVKAEFFYDPGQLLGGLVKGKMSEEHKAETSSSCPFFTTA
ncbi:pathogen-related protein [Coffea arabica]|uniref:Pathogen-related protein n=1 Tax=Coffea arabica TaxID=13443 RepID=A0A6P6US73_COFAR|nr:pathogen-related protein-like [Coffea arabica]